MAGITVWGKLGADAIVRTTQGGDSVCSFSVAHDQREGREKTTAWYRCSLWGKRGESLAPYLLKGASVTVFGDQVLTEYEGKLQANVKVYDIALQGGRGDGPQGGDAYGKQHTDGSRSGGQQPSVGNFADLDDDIPF